jgi:hypothetical protein
LISLSKKYFSFPPLNIPYFSAIQAALQSQIQNEQNDEVQPPTTHRNKHQHVAVDAMVESTLALVKARPQCPKKAKTSTTSSQKCVLTYFSKNPSKSEHDTLKK